MMFQKEQLWFSQEISSYIEINQIEECVNRVIWHKHCHFVDDATGKRYEHQKAYNRLFDLEFSGSGGCQLQPRLVGRKRADFRKNEVVGEIQFGNRSTVYGDFLKLYDAYKENLLKLAVYIVPFNAKQFFPARDCNAFSSMAEFKFAYEQFKIRSDMAFPICLIGLLPSNTEETK